MKKLVLSITALLAVSGVWAKQSNPINPQGLKELQSAKMSILNSLRQVHPSQQNVIYNLNNAIVQINNAYDFFKTSYRPTHYCQYEGGFGNQNTYEGYGKTQSEAKLNARKLCLEDDDFYCNSKKYRCEIVNSISSNKIELRELTEEEKRKFGITDESSKIVLSELTEEEKRQFGISDKSNKVVFRELTEKEKRKFGISDTVILFKLIKNNDLK